SRAANSGRPANRCLLTRRNHDPDSASQADSSDPGVAIATDEVRERIMKKMGFAVSCVAAVVLAAGCSRQPDPSAGAEKALKDANLNEVRVDWDRDARVAHLRGMVETPTDRQRAEDVAAAAVGTTGKVLNELTIKGVNDKTAGDFDGQIKRTLKRMV